MVITFIRRSGPYVFVLSVFLSKFWLKFSTPAFKLFKQEYLFGDDLYPHLILFVYLLSVLIQIHAQNLSEHDPNDTAEPRHAHKECIIHVKSQRHVLGCSLIIHVYVKRKHKKIFFCSSFLCAHFLIDFIFDFVCSVNVKCFRNKIHHLGKSSVR